MRCHCGFKQTSGFCDSKLFTWRLVRCQRLFKQFFFLNTDRSGEQISAGSGSTGEKLANGKGWTQDKGLFLESERITTSNLPLLLNGTCYNSGCFEDSEPFTFPLKRCSSATLVSEFAAHSTNCPPPFASSFWVCLFSHPITPRGATHFPLQHLSCVCTCTACLFPDNNATRLQ